MLSNYRKSIAAFLVSVAGAITATVTVVQQHLPAAYSWAAWAVAALNTIAVYLFPNTAP